jgi:hypothetical protein
VQGGLWNQTDGTAFEEEALGTEQVAQARELLTKAGATENTSGKGLMTHLEDPNAGSTTTGAVDASGNVMPSEPAEAAAVPPSIRIATAVLEPKSVLAGHAAHSTLVVGTSGEVSELELKLQSHAGHRWKAVKKLPRHKLVSGTATFRLNFGQLAPGKYRLLVTVSGPDGEGESAAAPLLVHSRKRSK